MSTTSRELRAAGKESGLPLKLTRNPFYANFLKRAYMRFDPETKQPRHIAMGYNPIWNERQSAELRTFANGKEIDDLPLAMAMAIFQHEIGHRDVCPINIDHTKVMTDAVIAVLVAGDKFTIKTAHYICNLIADLIVNRAQDRAIPLFASGLMMDYYDHPDKRGLMRGKLFHYLFRSDRIRPTQKYRGLFGVFIGSLLSFFNDPAIDELYDAVMTNGEAEEAAIAQMVALFESMDSTNPSNWHVLTLRATRILLPFIDEEEAIPFFNPSGYFDNVDFDMPETEVGFDDWMFEVGALFPERHKFYSEQAAKIDFHTIVSERQLTPGIRHLPVFFEREFVRESPEDSGNKKDPHNVLILVDASPSMGFGQKTETNRLTPNGPMPGTGDRTVLPWGDRSRYHAASLFTYGVLRYLREASPTDKPITARVATFARNVRATPWFRPREAARHVPQILLDQLYPETQLDADRLDKLIGDRDGVLLFIVTDGDLQQDQQVQSVVTYLTERANSLSFHMISIMERGSLFDALATLPNGKTHFVSEPKDMYRLGLGLLVEELPTEPSSRN